MKFVLKAVANNGPVRSFQKAEVSSVFAVKGLEARICQDPKDHLVIFDDSIICIYSISEWINRNFFVHLFRIEFSFTRVLKLFYLSIINNGETPLSIFLKRRRNALKFQVSFVRSKHRYRSID